MVRPIEKVLVQTLNDLTNEIANVGLLEIVADYIERHPEEFDMYWWNKRPTWLQRVFFGCPKTVGCIGCHVVRLGGGDVDAENIPGQAQRLLGLNDLQAQSLFFVDNWPEPYKTQFEFSEMDSKGRAWIAAQRVRYFATAGK